VQKRNDGRVLVTGANGFVGRALVRTVIDTGRHVRAAVRHLDRADGPFGDWSAVGDVGPETDWFNSLRDVDAVIHLVARTHVLRDPEKNLQLYRRTNVDGTRRLAEQAAAAGVRRLVFVSSIKVNGERTFQRAYGPDDVPAPEDAYGLSKHEAEQIVARIAEASGMEHVIVRPPLVYGPGVKGNFPRLIRLVQKGVPLPLASVQNQRSMVALENLVDLLVRCIDAPGATGRTLLVRDEETLSTPGLIRHVASALGRPVHLFPVPTALLYILGRLTGRTSEIQRLCGSLVVDDSETRRLLEWSPPVFAQDAIRATVADFLKRKAIARDDQ